MNATDFLSELSAKLAKIFNVAYGCQMDENLLNEAMKNMIDAALEFQALDVSYRRIFVIGIIEVFHRVKEDAAVITKDEARQIFRSKVRMITEAEKEEVESEEF